MTSRRLPNDDDGLRRSRTRRRGRSSGGAGCGTSRLLILASAAAAVALGMLTTTTTTCSAFAPPRTAHRHRRQLVRWRAPPSADAAVVAASSPMAAVPKRQQRIAGAAGPLHAVDPAAATVATAAATAASSGLMSLFASPAGAVAVLAGIILIHEAGHYLAARALYGIDVEEFSIGVGPKLFGFKAFGDEFNLRALPLGGYVRFPENYNATLVREMEDKAFKAAREFDKSREKDLKDQVLNTLTLGAVDDRRRKEEKERRMKMAEELKNMPWWKKIGAGKQQQQQQGDVELLMDPDDVEIEYYDDPNLLQNRPWQQRAVVLSAGVFFNLVLAFSIYFGQITAGPGVPSPVFDSGALITSAPRPGAAAEGVLTKGDVVLTVNGKPITVSTSPSAGEAQKGISDFISTIRSTSDGEELRLTVMHPGDRQPVDISVKPRRATSPTGSGGPATLGVLLSPNFVESKVLRSDSWIEGAGLAAKYTRQVTMDTAKGLLSIFGDLARGKGVSGQVSGPIGLIETGTTVVKTQDWTTVLIFAAAISVNLGVVNALPLPALDGGQLLFVLSEAITGRKVDQRFQEGLTGAALFVLLLISASAAFNDIEAIFR